MQPARPPLRDRGIRRRPRHPERARDLGHAATHIAHRDGNRPPQPARRAPTRRDLADRLGERTSRTVRFDATPATLVPDNRDSLLPVRQISRRGPHVLLHRRRRNPARGAAGRRFISRLDVHHPLAELDLLNVSDLYSGQPKQHRRIVIHARDLSRLLP